MTDVLSWMAEVSGAGWFLYVKRLSGNDTLANQAHQAGPYVPRRHAFAIFPSLWERRHESNPRAAFPVLIDSHGVEATPSCIWYNTRTRNECRLTGWGGAKSPVMDPEATGSICLFAFRKRSVTSDSDAGRVWLCRSVEEEDLVESQLGPIEPKSTTLLDAYGIGLVFEEEPDKPCNLAPEALPDAWKLSFPAVADFVAFAVDRLRSARAASADVRLLKRRDCEEELFRSVERYYVLPRVREGFATVDLFVSFANAVTNRRKSRSGMSLELQAQAIFDEESLPYSRGETSELKKRPDFLFPSGEAYRNPAFPAEKLQMLAAKTTCKDRWRQVINEADRIPTKYLLTLQRGMSQSQFAEMKNHGVQLVVPEPLRSKFPPPIRGALVSFEAFIAMTKAKCT